MRIYSSAARNWKLIGERLGLESGDMEGIRKNNYNDDRDCVTAVFRHWFDNANNLPNKKRYPKKWSGLIRLLEDSSLGELAVRVKQALTAPYSNIRNTLY